MEGISVVQPQISNSVMSWSEQYWTNRGKDTVQSSEEPIWLMSSSEDVWLTRKQVVSFFPTDTQILFCMKRP